MNARNRLLMRSILFGAITKVGGSLMVFIGIPIIAHALPAADYAIFLRSIGAAAFVTLLIGSTAPIAIRALAEAIAANDPVRIEAAERDMAGLFLAAIALSLAISVPVLLWQHPPGLDITLLAMGIIGVAGLLNYADIYYVALRQDHLLSLFQFAATLTMLALLAVFAGRGLLAVTLIYFGVPMLGQIGGLARLRAMRRLHVRPVFTVARWRDQLRQTLPLAGNSFADYAKIYGSGLLLAGFATTGGYARYATIVLFVSRLANPMSLISRPLMPAFIDALHHRDARWLNRLRLMVGALAGGALGLALVAALLLPVGWLTWALPAALVRVTRAEIVLAALFLWGLSMMSLLNPLFVARRRAGFVMRVNAGFVGIGIAAGFAAAMAGRDGGMLAAMAITTAGAALTLTVTAVRSLMSLRTPAHTADPDGLMVEPEARPDLS